MTKVYAVVLVLLSCSASLVSQEQPQILNPSQYLFTEFSKGRVAMKAGKDLNLFLNYNIVTGKMVFIQKGEVYDMMNYDGVDTVYISGHRFIPVGEVFYEIGVSGKFSLFIQHSGKVQAPSKPAAYGGTSEVAASNYIDNIRLGSDVYRLKTDPTIVVKPEKIYWSLAGKEWVMIKSLKHLAKVSGKDYGLVSGFAKEKDLKFSNPDDVVLIAKFCSEK